MNVEKDSTGHLLLRGDPRETMINAYAGRERPRGWSFLAHHWELIIVSLGRHAEKDAPPARAGAAILTSVLPHAPQEGSRMDQATLGAGKRSLPAEDAHG